MQESCHRAWSSERVENKGFLLKKKTKQKKSVEKTILTVFNPKYLFTQVLDNFYRSNFENDKIKIMLKVFFTRKRYPFT